jgi:hypothetical protein
MNLTSLNKIVSLLVSGVLALLVLVLWCVCLGLKFDAPPDWWKKIAEPLLQREFMATVMLGSLIVFCGLLVQSVGEHLILYRVNTVCTPASSGTRPIGLRRFLPGNLWRKFFLLDRSRQKERQAREAANTQRGKLQDFPFAQVKREEGGLSYVPVLFHRGSPNAIRWGTENAAVALLAANFLALTLCAAIPILVIAGWVCIFPLLLIVWLLAGTVVSKRLYAFEIASAEAALVLWDELQARENAGAEKRPANGDAPQLRSSYHVT